MKKPKTNHTIRVLISAMGLSVIHDDIKKQIENPIENPTEEQIAECKDYLETNIVHYAEQMRDFFHRKFPKLPTERDVSNCLIFLALDCKQFSRYNECSSYWGCAIAYKRPESIFAFEEELILDHAIQLAILRKNIR